MMGAAALAAPFPALEMSAGGRTISVSLAVPAFSYTYRQSIYEVPVREELRTAAGAISIDRAISPDLRALEYFRWPGEATRHGTLLGWDAPPNASKELHIFVVADGDQVIATTTRTTVLRDVFGDDVSVTVRPARRPLAQWLWGFAR